MEKTPRDIIEICAKEGVKTIPCGDSFDLHMEWVKWLSYTPEFERDRINELKTKEEKTSDDFIEIGNYYHLKTMEKLFKKYGTKGMKVEEYEKVLYFMEEQSLEDFMESKLTEEEITKAKEKIKEYKNIPEETLSKKVYTERREANYMQLPMIDAYILHYINKVVQVRNTISFQRLIKNQMDESVDRSHKSLVYASNPDKRH